MSDPWDEVDPSPSTRNTLRWAWSLGATTLGEAHDLLEQLEISNDGLEVLGEEDTVDDVRVQLEDGLALLGSDTALATLI